MKKVGIFLIMLMLATGVGAQNQNQAAGGNSQAAQTTNSQNQQTEKSSGVTDKIKEEIKKRQHRIKTPNATTGVRGYPGEINFAPVCPQFKGEGIQGKVS